MSILISIYNIYTGKKKFDKKKQSIQIFSDICTVQMKHLADSQLSGAGIHG